MATYTSRYPRTRRRTDDMVRKVRSIIDDAGINYLSITGRAKSPASFSDKVARRASELGHTDFDPALDITDQVGVRIITYVHSDIEPVAQLLAENFTVLEDRDMGRETASEGRFGYASRHMLISNDPSATAYDAAQCMSVQLRTVLQHAWAEFEHDIRYKQGTAAPSAQVDRLFTLAAGLIELADQQFDEIAALKAPGTETDRDVELTAETLPGVLAIILGNRFPLSRSEHYRFLAELLEQNGVRHLGQLEQLLDDTAIAHVHDAMRYRFRPGQVRLIDDLLLNKFGKQHIEATAESGDRPGRKRRLTARLKALRAAH